MTSFDEIWNSDIGKSVLTEFVLSFIDDVLKNDLIPRETLNCLENIQSFILESVIFKEVGKNYI